MMWKLSSIATVPCAVMLAVLATSSLTAGADDLVFDQYDPSPDLPFGQLNPDAPPEVAAYSFMIGYWDCSGTAYQQGEEPTNTQSQVHGQYYLNGFGFINHTYQASSVGVMTYSFDAHAGGWVIDYTAAPSPTHSRWLTVAIDEAGALASQTPGQVEGTALRSVFYDIGSDAFHWRLDFVTTDAAFTIRRSTCQRSFARE